MPYTWSTLDDVFFDFDMTYLGLPSIPVPFLPLDSLLKNSENDGMLWGTTKHRSIIPVFVILALSGHWEVYSEITGPLFCTKSCQLKFMTYHEPLLTNPWHGALPAPC